MASVELGDRLGAEKSSHRENDRGLRARQDVGSLAGGEAGVDRYQYGARVVNGKAGDDPVPGVRRPDRDPSAGLHAESGEGRGRATDLIVQLSEGEVAVIGDQSGMVGVVEGHPVKYSGCGQPVFGGHGPAAAAGIPGHGSSRLAPSQQSKCLLG